MVQKLVSVLLLLVFFKIPCGEWVTTGKEVKTIFYQGILASQTQASKYTGTRGFKGTTGERIVCEKAIDVIGDVFVKPEIDEIVPLTYEEYKNLDSLFINPITQISGIISKFQNKLYGITASYDTNNNGALSHTLQGHRVFLGKMNLGQEPDIANHKRKYDRCVKKFPNADIVLFGVSRGSAATFDAYSTYHYDKVKMIICEGCFDSIEKVFAHRYPWVPQIIQRTLYILISRFIINHKPSGIAPINMVDRFVKNSTIPVIFITSKTDNVVPTVCTKEIAQAVANAGHKKVYLLELQHSSHSRYMMDNEADRTTYQAFLHALYKTYDLPYIASFAKQGKDLLEQCLVKPTNVETR